MALHKAVIMALVLVGLVAACSAFDSRPYENKPSGGSYPPVPSTPPWNPRYKRAPVYYLEEPSYQYEPESLEGARFRRFSVPLVVVPMPAPPPPPPMA